MNTTVGGATLTATLQLKDAQGNSLSRGGGRAITIQSTDPVVAQVGTVVDPDNGTFTATVTPVGAGVATVYATIKGVAVTVTVALVVSEVDAGLSLLSADATSVLADGTTNVTFSAFMFDQYGAPMVGVTVTPAATGAGTNTFSTPAVTNDSGYTTFTFHTNAAVTHIISVTCRGVTISQTVTINAITPQPTADATRTTIAAATVSVVNGGTVLITVQAKESQGTNITIGGDTVTLSVSGGTAQGSVTSPAADNLDGTYAGTFTASGVGTAKTVSGTINGVTISGGTNPTIAVATATSASYTPGDILHNASFENSWNGTTNGGSGNPNVGLGAAYVTLTTAQAKVGSYSVMKPLPITPTGSQNDQTTTFHYPFYNRNGQNGYLYAPNPNGVDRLFSRFWFKLDTDIDTGNPSVYTTLKLAMWQQAGFNKFAEFGFHQNYLVFSFITEWNTGSGRIRIDRLSNVFANGWNCLETDMWYKNGPDNGFASCAIWYNDVDVSIAAPPVQGSTTGLWLNGRINAGSRTSYNNTQYKIGVWSGFNVLNGGNPTAANIYFDNVSISTLGRVGP